MGYRKVCFASSAPLLHQYFAEPRVWIEVLKLYHETFSSLKWFTLMETDTSLILKLIPLPALTKIFSRKKLTPLNYTKLIKWMQQNFMTVCYHVTYEFQSKSTIYICLNVKELLPRNRRDIWGLSDCSPVAVTGLKSHCR